MNSDYFISESIKIHNDKYDYSLVEYVNFKTKVKIICPEHGVFTQTPDNHKNKKRGCPKCSKKHKWSTYEVIEKFINIHGNKYDYSLVKYINAKTKVKILCPAHGVFEQRVDHHIKGVGCLKCYNLNKKSKEEFVNISNNVHNFKYSYTEVEYKNNRSKVKIICPIHGAFEQTPLNHINKKQGCPKCVGKHKTTEDFIIESKKINGTKYDYSKVEYKNNKTKIKLVCPVHGDFEQIPNNHLSKKYGCPFCNESHGEKLIRLFLDDLKINYVQQKSFDGCVYKRNLRFDFYLPDYNTCIEFDGVQHFKAFDIFGGTSKLLEIKNNDNIKDVYCMNNGIKLVRIKYDDDIINKLWELLIYK